MRLLVIVPCYNPPEGWETALAQHFSDFQKEVQHITGNIGLVVVNDGSPKNATASNFEHLTELLPEVKIISYPYNRGKGFALRQGVMASEADVYLVTDADFPYTLESMTSVVETLTQQGGIAAGNRDTGYYARVPLFRRYLSRSLRWMLRNIMRQPIGDSQCGLKAFDTSGKNIFLQTTIDRFLFDLEFLMLANGQINVTPVPVELRDGVIFSKVGWKILAAEAGNFFKLLTVHRLP